MSVPRYAVLAARVLRRAQPAYVAPDTARERGLATIDRALGAQRRRRAGRRRAFGAVLVAAASVMVWLVSGAFRAPQHAPRAVAQLVSVRGSPVGGGALFFDSTGEVPLGPDVALRVGGRITTASGGGARLELSTGTRLELDSESTLTLQNLEDLQRFTLARGVLHASVARLAPAQRFVVDTPDTQVEVRGTSFRLQVMPAPEACGGGVRSRLEVQEGVVEVREGNSLARIGAGQHWPPSCVRDDRAADSTPSPSAALPEAPAVVDPLPRAAGAPRPKPGRPATRAIAAQNDLFEQAMRARQRGDTSAALRAYATLLHRYPKSPLVENALVERIRLLSTHDVVRARREAERYLERFPNGFARVEAERLVEDP